MNTGASVPQLTRGAFTRIEVMACAATVLTLVVLSIPAAANARTQTKGTLCLANLRHLIAAWQMYATEHNGALVVNYSSLPPGGTSNVPTKLPWVAGFMDWSSRSDNINLRYLRDPKYAALAPYLTASNNVHKCPADLFQSPVQRQIRWHRVRSVSMNTTVGDGTGLIPDPLYRKAKTLSQLILPSPAETTVILDEHPDSLNDSLFVPPTRGRWFDLPGNLHNGAGSFNFADGHAELHNWRSTILRRYRVRYTVNFPATSINDPDITWLSYHSQRSRDATF